MSDRILMADGPHGLLCAGIAPVSAYIVPKVGDSKLMALLAPYKDEDGARAALVAAGGENIREWTR